MSRYDVPMDTFSPTFLIIGMASEYFGMSRPNPERGGLEGFYPHETAVADFYERCLARLQVDHGITTPIERTTSGSGHCEFHSPALAAVLAAAYGEHEGIEDSMFPPYINRAEEIQWIERASFLLGAYLRYGTGNEIRLANAHRKAEVLMHVLATFGCPTLTLTQRPRNIPNSNRITFEPSPGVQRLLDRGMPW
jgi:hypothetical protein